MGSTSIGSILFFLFVTTPVTLAILYAWWWVVRKVFFLILTLPWLGFVLVVIIAIASWNLLWGVADPIYKFAGEKIIPDMMLEVNCPKQATMIGSTSFGEDGCFKELVTIKKEIIGMFDASAQRCIEKGKPKSTCEHDREYGIEAAYHVLAFHNYEMRASDIITDPTVEKWIEK